MREVRFQMAVGNDNVSVKHRWCWATLLSGRFTRLTRFSVTVNHGSTLELKTTLTDDARGAKAAADAGSNCGGMDTGFSLVGAGMRDQRGSSERYEAGGDSGIWADKDGRRQIERQRKKRIVGRFLGGPKTRELVCAP